MRVYIIILFLLTTFFVNGQTVNVNPVCYGQPIELFCSFLTGGCNQAGSTYHWENFSGSWSVTGESPSTADPSLCYNNTGYASDKFYLSVQYKPPQGGFSGGRVTVSVTPEIIPYTTSTNVTCKGGSDGTITLSILSSGITSPSFLWSDGATTKNRTGLSAGTYTCVISYSPVIGTTCTNTTRPVSVTITEPDDYLSVTGTISDVLCYGESTGSVVLNTTGGTAPYTYLWSSGATTSTINSVPAGLYTVTVTDYNNCTTSEGFTVGQTDSISVTAIVTNISSCGGVECSGSIDLSVSGGVPPYSYLWENRLDSTNQDVSNLCEGSIKVTVTDSVGCIKIKTYTITLSGTFTIISSVVNTRCTLPSGMINVEGSCPENTYTWLWSDGSTSQYRMGLSAGTYGVTATDSNGATASKSITVN